MAARALSELEGLARAFGGDAAARKLSLLEGLGRRRLPSARAVLRLHEVLVFLRAYPDDAAVLATVERLLAGFERRADLRRHRAALANSGIAGTPIHYSFFLPTARWIVRRHPGLLRVDWASFGHADRLLSKLWTLMPDAEENALTGLDHGLRAWVRLLKGDQETDAEFLVRRLAAMRADHDVAEELYDDLDMPMRIDPAPGSPSRTAARYAKARVHFQTAPLDTRRPRLRAALAVPPRAVRSVSTAEGRVLIDMARASMVTRSRDLDVFMHGDPRDVRLVDCGDGLQFAAIGMRPERRLFLEAVYGFLTLKNGVPIGYVLASGLNGSSEIAYNIFDTYRGGEAGQVYGRILSMVHHLLGSTAFVVDPYQLGHDNEEGLSSGAWWFYYKLGYRPQDPAIRRLVAKERARIAKNPRHRSTRAALQRLSAEYMYWFDGPVRREVLGLLDLANLSLGVSRHLARRFGGDREAGERACAKEAAALLGVRSMKRFTPAQRAAWKRWAPLVMAMPRVARWGTASKRALVAVIRAKGGRRESDFVRLLNAHRPLRRALLAFADAKHA